MHDAAAKRIVQGFTGIPPSVVFHNVDERNKNSSAL
jgi:hypothetical protein